MEDDRLKSVIIHALYQFSNYYIILFGCEQLYLADELDIGFVSGQIGNVFI